VGLESRKPSLFDKMDSIPDEIFDNDLDSVPIQEISPIVVEPVMIIS